MLILGPSVRTHLFQHRYVMNDLGSCARKKTHKLYQPSNGSQHVCLQAVDKSRWHCLFQVCETSLKQAVNNSEQASLMGL